MEGDTAESLTQEFGDKHNLDEGMRAKLKTMLQQQIDGILEKIEEEDHTSQITGEGSEQAQQHYEEPAQHSPEQPSQQEQIQPAEAQREEANQHQEVAQPVEHAAEQPVHQEQQQE